ncbi:Sec14p-like phosphatidylinositol transfer family protein [Rhynchospora pubera]|uniref:Sec14p-like phosphatidylinositol transfer family protein n=1 Tax=Rhynchospora pubera TaxID=906938 RepID=A0AAV8D554_9POAL|nr:Sec14p-like phosphatidylinositol transfer family protein [Rhynchospora pubera]KAJ4814017.1 Sec14p-like phosphatidylinositol transfer family protein [Rhynchospora pubera]
MTSSNCEVNHAEKQALFEEQILKINEVRGSLGPLSGKSALYCSDASIARYLIARNWNVKKATKMLKETLKWRAEYKPDEIRWDEVAHEAETGKIYRANYRDKTGRSVLVMRPGRQNTKSTKGQIQYLVYCMENAILNLPPGQDQMVWLIDFEGFNLSHISVKVTKETAHVLQSHYPERLGVAILYNPPKFFESFWIVVKPFLEPKTYRKVKFAYSDDQNTKGIMEDLFKMDELESCFGGNNQTTFEFNDYGARMREDDKKMPLFWSPENNMAATQDYVMANGSLHSSNSEADLEPEEEENRNEAVKQEEDSGKLNGSGTSLSAKQ